MFPPLDLSLSSTYVYLQGKNGTCRLKSSFLSFLSLLFSLLADEVKRHVGILLLY